MYVIRFCCYWAFHMAWYRRFIQKHALLWFTLRLRCFAFSFFICATFAAFKYSPAHIAAVTITAAVVVVATPISPSLFSTYAFFFILLPLLPLVVYYSSLIRVNAVCICHYAARHVITTAITITTLINIITLIHHRICCYIWYGYAILHCHALHFIYALHIYAYSVKKVVCICH